MEPAPACSQQLLNAHQDPIRQGVLEGHRPLLPECSHLPRDEVGFLSNTQRDRTLLYAAFSDVLGYHMHVYATVSTGPEGWGYKPLFTCCDSPLVPLGFHELAFARAEPAMSTKTSMARVAHTRGSECNVKHESMMLELYLVRRKRPRTSRGRHLLASLPSSYQSLP